MLKTSFSSCVKNVDIIFHFGVSRSAHAVVFEQQRTGSVLVREPILFENHGTKRLEVNQHISTTAPNQPIFG